jgi:hypothetical protein
MTLDCRSSRRAVGLDRFRGVDDHGDLDDIALTVVVGMIGRAPHG